MKNVRCDYAKWIDEADNEHGRGKVERVDMKSCRHYSHSFHIAESPCLDP